MEDEFHVISIILGFVAFLVYLFFAFSHRYLAFYGYFIIWGGLLFLSIKLDMDFYWVNQAVPSIVGSLIGMLWGFFSSAGEDASHYRALKREQRERAVRALEKMANKK